MLKTVLDGLVRKDVKLLLLFALHVRGTQPTDDVHQAGAADRGSDDLGRQRDVVQQVRELSGRFRIPALLLEDEPFDGGH